MKYVELILSTFILWLGEYLRSATHKQKKYVTSCDYRLLSCLEIIYIYSAIKKDRPLKHKYRSKSTIKAYLN